MAISLGLTIVFGMGAAFLFKKMNLPGMIGMLLVGVLFGPYMLNFFPAIVLNASADFRMVALIVILLRAGFELKKGTLKQVGKTAVIMSIVPAVFEMAAITMIAPLLLGITYFEAALLGTILAAVSPAIVVTAMVEFMDQKKGEKKGIPAMVLSASALDVVFVLVLFTMLLGVHKDSTANVFWMLASMPVSVASGIGLGLLTGLLLFKLFEKFEWQSPNRTLLVLCASIFIIWLEKVCEAFFPIAGMLAVMAIGVTIVEKSESIAVRISQKLKKIWVFAQIILFVMVGAQVNVEVAWKSGAAGVLVIFIGLVFRSAGTYLSLWRTGYTLKEKIFCIVSYLPKATVQAAIGAMPLAVGIASGDIILAVAVLSIIITAPIGAIGITLLGDRVLEANPDNDGNFTRDMKYPG